jgi:hypothetical protein
MPEHVNQTSGEIRVTNDLVELSKPFPKHLVERVEGNDYVAHHVITQRLLSVVGPFDFKLVELVRGDVAGIPPNPEGKSNRARQGRPALSGVVVAAVYRLVCEVDGRRTEVEEIGECGDPHNWAHDGARLKDAASDALKRCAMRLGLGLHLWAQEMYFLDKQLAVQAAGPTKADPEQAAKEQLDRLAGRGQQPAWAKDGSER